MDYFEFDGVRYVLESEQPATIATHKVLTDAERRRYNRFSYPMVFWFSEDQMPITKEWQLFLVAINYEMDIRKVSQLLDNGRAFCNGTGFNDSDTERQNHILREGLDARELPKFSKVFTCGGAVVEVKNGIVTSFDGNMPPPLKDGLAYPLSRLDAMDPDSYRFTPENEPHLFYSAVTVNDDFTPRPFVNGAFYPWYQSGLVPVSWMPLVGLQSLREPLSVAENAVRLVRI
jgi:hypothetical protein